MSQTELVYMIVLLFPIAFITMWSFVLWLLSRLSGWSRLAQTYGTPEPRTPAGNKAWRWQSGSVGLVGYRGCLHIGVSPSGVALAVAWPFRLCHQDLFIPWNALHDRKDTKIFWYQTTRFQVGNPTQGSVQVPTEVLGSFGDKL
jgi:hypothetical protein